MVLMYPEMIVLYTRGSSATAVTLQQKLPRPNILGNQFRGNGTNGYHIMKILAFVLQRKVDPRKNPLVVVRLLLNSTLDLFPVHCHV